MRGPATIGRFVVRRELGRGAKGIVYHAHDPQLGREVAVKVLLGAADAKALARFAQEARATSAVSHPGVVQVHEVGSDLGKPFIVMELVDGQSLETTLQAGPLPPRRAVEVVRDAARALGEAHARGVVHRDVKPANLMLDRGGRVRVSDFGLGRVGASQLTRTGDFIGTPATMPPEQAGDSAEKHGPASDVYALGATLYLALTGRAPIEADTPHEFFARLLREPPTPLREVDPRLPAALAKVVHRCLEKDPARRYAHAGVLAVALDGWLEGDAPRPAGLPVRALVASGVVLVLSAVGVGATLALRDSPPATPPAEPTPAPASTEAPRAWAPDEAPARRLVASLPASLRLRRVLGRWGAKHADSAPALAVSPDGRRLLLGTAVWHQGTPGTLQLRDLATGEELHAWAANEGGIADVAFVGADRAVALGQRGDLTMWRLAGARPVAERTWSRDHGGVGLVAAGSTLFVMWADGILGGLVEGQLQVDAAPIAGGPCVIAPLADGRLLALGEGALVVFDPRTSVRDEVGGAGGRPTDVAVTPDGEWLLAILAGGRVRLCEAARGVWRDVGIPAEERPYRVRWVDARTAWIATGGRAGLHALDIPSGDVRAVPTACQVLGDLQRLPDERVAVGALDGALRWLDRRTGRDLTPPPAEPHVPAVVTLSLAADGGRLLVGCAGSDLERSTAHVFDLTTGERTHVLDTPLEAVLVAGFLEGGRALVAGPVEPDRVMTWRLERGPPEVQEVVPCEYQRRLSAGAVSPDGRSAITAGEDGRLHLWKCGGGALGGRPRAELVPRAAGRTTTVAFAPDGTFALSASVMNDEEGRTVVHRWSPAGAALGSFQVDEIVEALAVIGPRDVVAAADRTVRCLDADGVERLRYPDHRARVVAVAVTTDGALLASGSVDGIVRVCDARAGAARAELDLALIADRPTQVAFAPDGRTLYVGTARGVVLELELER